MPIDITGLFQPSGGAGAFKLTLADDIDVIGATDGTGDGTMATADLLICETNPAATAVKKILISQLPFLSGITANAAEVNVLDGVTAGAITASKAVVVDASRDIATLHDVTIDGTFSDGTLSIVGGEILDATTLEATTTLGIEIGDAQQLVLTDGKLNPTTDSDIDLGDSTHYFKNAYIDTLTTTGALTIGSTIGCGAITSSGLLGVTVAGNTAVLQNTTDAASNQVAQFKSGNRATAANDDEGYLSLFCDDDAGTQVEVARLIWKISDVSSGSETGALDIQLADGGGGSFTSILLLEEDNQATFGQLVKASAFYAKDPSSVYYLKIMADDTKYSADRLLEIDLNNADRVVTIAYNVTLDQPVGIGTAPAFTADNFSDGGSNAIVTTTQETNWDTHLSSDGSDHTFLDQAVTIAGTPTHSTLTLTSDLLLTNAATAYIKLGPTGEQRIWSNSDTDLIIRNYTHGAEMEIGAENAAGSLRNILLDPDVPSFAPGNSDGTLDLGKAARQWKDLYSVNATLSGDLLVDGGDIGITGDTNLLQLAANALTVNGAIYCTNFFGIGDPDTYITFSADRFNFTVGGVQMIDFTEAFTDVVTVNPTGADVDFIVEGDTNTNCLKVDAGNDNVTINAAAVSAHYDLMLAGDGVLGLKETATPTADATYGKVYCKDTNKLYFQDGAGVEHEIAFAV